MSAGRSPGFHIARCTCIYACAVFIQFVSYLSFDLSERLPMDFVKRCGEEEASVLENVDGTHFPCLVVFIFSFSLLRVSTSIVMSCGVAVAFSAFVAACCGFGTKPVCLRMRINKSPSVGVVVCVGWCRWSSGFETFTSPHIDSNEVEIGPRIKHNSNTTQYHLVEGVKFSWDFEDDWITANKGKYHMAGNSNETHLRKGTAATFWKTKGIGWRLQNTTKGVFVYNEGLDRAALTDGSQQLGTEN